MAGEPITWRNVAGPSLAEAARPLAYAQNAFASGFDSVSQALKDFHDQQKEGWKQQDADATAAERRLLLTTKTPEDFAALQASGQMGQTVAANGARLDRAALDTLADNRPAILQDRVMADQKYGHAQLLEKELPAITTARAAMLKKDWKTVDDVMATLSPENAALVAKERDTVSRDFDMRKMHDDKFAQDIKQSNAQIANWATDNKLRRDDFNLRSQEHLEKRLASLVEQRSKIGTTVNSADGQQAISAHIKAMPISDADKARLTASAGTLSNDKEFSNISPAAVMQALDNSLDNGWFKSWGWNNTGDNFKENLRSALANGAYRTQDKAKTDNVSLLDAQIKQLKEGLYPELKNAPAAGQGKLTHDGLPARQNADGSYSTEVSITVTDPRLNGGKPTNIPSLWGGKEVDQNTAVKNALASGKTYQAFGSINEAVTSAKTRSEAGGAQSQQQETVAEGGGRFAPAIEQAYRQESAEIAAGVRKPGAYSPEVTKAIQADDAARLQATLDKHTARVKAAQDAGLTVMDLPKPTVSRWDRDIPFMGSDGAGPQISPAAQAKYDKWASVIDSRIAQGTPVVVAPPTAPSANALAAKPTQSVPVAGNVGTAPFKTSNSQSLVVNPDGSSQFVAPLNVTKSDIKALGEPQTVVKAAPAAVPKGNSGRVLVTFASGKNDGDTFDYKPTKDSTLDTSNGLFRCRLDSVDAPEVGHGNKKPGQYYGPEAASILKNMIDNKEVTIKITGTNGNRNLCQVDIQGKAVDLELVRAGAAWLYQEYVPFSDPRRAGLTAAQESSKAAKRGLFADTNPTYPQTHRRTAWQE